MISTNPVSGAAAAHKAPKAATTAAEEQQQFKEMLAGLDKELQSMRKTDREKERERLAELQKKAKQKKMNDLRLRIQTLQSRVNMGQEGAERELSALKGELFMMMLFG